MRFENRHDAGQRLARRLAEDHLRQPVVLALPRGGVPIGFEVAQGLDAPLEVFVARKLGAPHHPEFGIGAIAEGGIRVVDERSVAALGLSDEDLDRVTTRETAELERRVRHYRGDRPLPDLEGRTAVLVDDGLATGVTAQASLRALAERRPGRLVLAVPVCAPETAARLAPLADDLVCLAQPQDFAAVGLWYRDFSQTSDGEVLDLLARSRSSAVGGRQGR